MKNRRHLSAIAAVIAFVVDLAGKFLEKLQPAVQFVIEKFTALTNFLADVLPPIFEKVVEFAQKVSDFFSKVFCGAIDAVKNAFQRVKETVERAIDKIKDFLGMDTRKTVQVDYWQTGGFVGQNAKGSSSWRGGLTWINERGAGGSIYETIRHIRKSFQDYKKLNLPSPVFPEIPFYQNEIENQKNFLIEREQNESRSISSVSDSVKKPIQNFSTRTENATITHAPVNITIQVYGRANESDRDFAERIAKAVKNYV